jgi:hypothetical protein
MRPSIAACSTSGETAYPPLRRSGERTNFSSGSGLASVHTGAHQGSNVNTGAHQGSNVNTRVECKQQRCTARAMLAVSWRRGWVVTLTGKERAEARPPSNLPTLNPVRHVRGGGDHGARREWRAQHLKRLPRHTVPAPLEPPLPEGLVAAGALRRRPLHLVLRRAPSTATTPCPDQQNNTEQNTHTDKERSTPTLHPASEAGGARLSRLLLCAR